ncbi:biotin--[acetyl-CoA-carboxylase] ligase [Marispirochaeta aestuarii]|uniref:biotin--[acetyl-CoA-carboxylase] ligase n=1 Tax=Marispirochaeta aestuarii TaxID=1963862 RepID=UPI001301CD01|nr:biotin--[acetyl-CoA-carboxylase] ligase [Marispirochaeta aestuarii]
MTELDLENPFFSAPVYHLEETGSTMEDAARLAAEGKASGFVVTADHQISGRGRIADRRWESSRGRDLLFTLALRLNDIPFGPTALSLRCGLGLALLLEKRWGLEPWIKWPNDLLIRGGKIAGILCQGRGDWFFTGIGLNLVSPTSASKLRRRAASVTDETGREEEPSVVLSALLPALKEALSARDWQEQINRRLFGAGSQVTVYPGAAGSGESYRARILGAAPDGGLILLDGDGRRVTLITGEIDFQDLS